MAILKAADLTRVEHQGLLDRLTLPADEAGCPRIWMEAPHGWTLDFWRGLEDRLTWCGSGRKPARIAATDCIGRAWAGRVFGPSGELRWRVIESLGEKCCRTVFLGNADWCPGQLIERHDVLAPLTPRTDRYFLWGQRTDASRDDWVELRIPHRFRYPVAGSPKGVRAVVELWCDAAGDLHFARLCDLEPLEEGQ